MRSGSENEKVNVILCAHGIHQTEFLAASEIVNERRPLYVKYICPRKKGEWISTYHFTQRSGGKNYYDFISEEKA